MADNFVQHMRNVTDKVLPEKVSYGRGSSQAVSPSDINWEDNDSRKEAQKLNQIYMGIREEEMAEKEKKILEMKEISSRINQGQ